MSLLVSMVLGLTSCAEVQELARDEQDLDAVRLLDAGEFPASERILSGLAPVDDDPELRVGDAALFALRIRKGAEVERQLILLEVLDLGWKEFEFEGRRARMRQQMTATYTRTPSGGEPVSQEFPVTPLQVALRRFTAGGVLLAESELTLFDEALRVGFRPDSDPDATFEEKAMASALFESLQSVATEDLTLQEVLFLLVDPPGVLDVIANFGVEVTLTSIVSSEQPELRPLVAAQGAPVRVAWKDLSINDDPALQVSLLVTRPRGASMVCGGLVGAFLANATDPERDGVLRLLATRRGPKL